ncbi:MAG: peptidyl-prolyl cis-trans isomerase [Myxococcales bacterium]
MRKSAVLLALLACSGGLLGCQAFTAGEQVSAPDPAQVRAKTAALARAAEKKDGDAHAAKEIAPAAVETATAAHILIRYAGSARAPADITRSKDDAKHLAESIDKKAKAPGADFAELANQYTEDPSGKSNGGRLGTFPRGRMVPAFDKATFELEPGSVSDVIETEYGFHIIYREK